MNTAITNALTYAARNSPYALGALGVIGGLYLFGRLVQYCIAPTKPRAKTEPVILNNSYYHELSKTYYTVYPKAYKSMPTETPRDLQNLIEKFMTRINTGELLFSNCCDAKRYLYNEKNGFLTIHSNAIKQWFDLQKKAVSIMDKTDTKSTLEIVNKLNDNLQFNKAGKIFLSDINIDELITQLEASLKKFANAKRIAAEIVQAYQ